MTSHPTLVLFVRYWTDIRRADCDGKMASSLRLMNEGYVRLSWNSKNSPELGEVFGIAEWRTTPSRRRASKRGSPPRWRPEWLRWTAWRATTPPSQKKSSASSRMRWTRGPRNVDLWCPDLPPLSKAGRLA